MKPRLENIRFSTQLSTIPYPPFSRICARASKNDIRQQISCLTRMLLRLLLLSNSWLVFRSPAGDPSPFSSISGDISPSKLLSRGGGHRSVSETPHGHRVFNSNPSLVLFPSMTDIGYYPRSTLNGIHGGRPAIRL
eukprot:1178807-Amorphochlora_amoeboformis.AAC.1